MVNTILGIKGKMGQAFINGLRIPVVKVVAGPCVVTQIKSTDIDGYWAVQLGFGNRKAKNTSKPLQGHFKKTTNFTSQNQNFPKYIREVRTDKKPDIKVGDKVKVSDIFSIGDVIAVSGRSKGKGFAGVMKRHHFAGGPRTHGQSDRQRSPGSIGQGTTPGRVFKGKKMAGRMGAEMVTVKNLHIVSIDPDENVINISGPIPGVPGGLVVLKRISKGSLSELGTETSTRVVEGEAAAEEVPSIQGEAPIPSKEPDKQEGEKNDDKN